MECLGFCVQPPTTSYKDTFLTVVTSLIKFRKDERLQISNESLKSSSLVFFFLFLASLQKLILLSIIITRTNRLLLVKLLSPRSEGDNEALLCEALAAIPHTCWPVLISFHMSTI